MEPEQIDRSAIEARLCTLIIPDCDNHRSLVTNDGDCGCATGTGQPGSPLSARCPQVIDCPEDSVLDERTCLCQPLNAGGTPFVQPTGCAVNLAGLPGGLDRWLLSDENGVNLHRAAVTIGGQTQVRDTLVFEGGFVAAAPPPFRTEDYASMGTRLFADVDIPDVAPPSGWRGLVQTHIAIGGSFDTFVSQTELSTLSPGVRRVEFPLPSSARTLLRQGGLDVRLTYIVNTDVNASELTSIVNFGFTGSALSTPNPSNPCELEVDEPPFSLPLPVRDPVIRDWPFFE
jgi:hypothetical protein